MTSLEGRPAGVTALSAFFAFGTLMSFISGVALLFPDSVLEPMWRLNPRARVGLSSLCSWGVLLMFTVSAACAFSAAGLWKGAGWGYRLATTVLLIQLLGDTVSALSGVEPRAAIGIPIVVALIAYLRSKREHFTGEKRRDA